MKLKILRYDHLALAALISLIAITLSGAAVRLTGSGLGCPEWPTCTSGKLVAPLEFHALIEFVNRLFTGVVSVAVALAALGATRLKPKDKLLVRLGSFLVVGIALQAILGGIVVKTGLTPIAVIGHYMLSAVLNSCAFLLWIRARNISNVSRRLTTSWPASTAVSKPTAIILLSVTTALLITGTIVTGTGPHAGDEAANRLPFSLPNVARIHSLVAWLTTAIAVITAIQIAASKARSRQNLSAATMLLASLVLQGAIGYAQYFTGVPPLLVELHIAGSIAVALSGVYVALQAFPTLLYRRSIEIDLRTTDQTSSGVAQAPIKLS